MQILWVSFPRRPQISKLKAARAAEFGKATAAQTDTVMREQLATVLRNIEAVRASGNVDPTSPTTVAMEDRSRPFQTASALLPLRASTQISRTH
jgi:hypothetical protein